MLLWCFQKLSNWELCTPQDLRKTCNITTWEHRESESLAQQGRSRAPWQELFQLVHLCFRGIQSIDSQLDFQTGHTTPTWSSYGWSPFTLLLAKPSATPDKSTNILPERCAYAWAMSNADWSATSLFTWQSTRCLENPCHSLTVQHQQKATKSNPLFLTAKGLNNILFDFEATRTWG